MGDKDGLLNSTVLSLGPSVPRVALVALITLVVLCSRLGVSSLDIAVVVVVIAVDTVLHLHELGLRLIQLASELFTLVFELLRLYLALQEQILEVVRVFEHFPQSFVLDSRIVVFNWLRSLAEDFLLVGIGAAALRSLVGHFAVNHHIQVSA